MKKIIRWLIETEERAIKLYEKSAEIFSGDKEFSEFLLHLSRDEKGHAEFMRKALQIIGDTGDYPPLTHIDDKTREGVDDYFSPCEKKIDMKVITKDDVMRCIIAIEYSEWNTLFLYVTNTLKHSHKQFNSTLSNIQNHKRYLEQFLELHAEYSKKLQELRDLPKIWEENIFVVDDEPIIVDMLMAILEDEHLIDSASNGKDGLKKLGDKYYSVIISDIDMPFMNGIEFFKKAVEKYPDIKERFLFFTGSFDSEVLDFFKQNKVKYLPKPSSIADIKKAIIEILSR